MELTRSTETREILDFSGVRLVRVTNKGSLPEVRYEYGTEGSLKPGNTPHVFYVFDECEGRWLRDMLNTMIPYRDGERKSIKVKSPRRANGTKS